MAKTELILPAMGEGIIEATIIKWLVKEGDEVEEDQPLLEIATDKVDSEIPSPVRGILTRIIMAEGEVPVIGSKLAEIEAYSDPSVDTETGPDLSTREIPRQTASGKFLTPLVRSIAKKENISAGELDSIQGSGDGGRITKEDLMAFIGKRTSQAGITTIADTRASEFAHEPVSINPVVGESPEITPGEGDRQIEMDRMRKLIAGHMVTSKQISPHVTSFIDADVTELVRWREANKEEFRKRENQNLTYTPVFIEAAARAIRDYPMVNVSVSGTTIIIKKSINIGMAVARPDGNLIVPVIRNADEKNLVGLVKSVNDLAERARNNKLQPSEISGGTFTITNFGTFRNTTGTPIINQPEVAILGIGAIIKKPVVMETSSGDVIAIRHIMTLSLSYDHRVVDGALGGMFLRRIAEYLETFDNKRKV